MPRSIASKGHFKIFSFVLQRAILSVALIASVVGVVGQAAEASTGTFRPARIITLTSNAISTTGNYGYSIFGSQAVSVSCTAASDCEILGTYQKGNSEMGFFVSTFNGTSQTSVVELPASSSMGSNPFPSASSGTISCSNSSNCVAILNTINGDYISVKANGTWQDAVAAGSSITLHSVSCASSTSCVAVGRDTSYQSVVEVFNGTTWTVSTARIAPSGAGTPTWGTLTSVSCWDSTHCAAVGQYMTQGHNAVTAMEVNIVSGVLQTPVALTLNSYTLAVNVLPTEVSCGSDGGCGIIGYSNDSPLAAQGSGNTWTPLFHTISPVDAIVNPSLSYVDGVSCVAASDCTITGSYAASTGGSNYRFAAMTGPIAGRATAELPPYAPGDDISNYYAENFAISCWSSTGCVTVGVAALSLDNATEAVFSVSGAAVPNSPTGVTAQPIDGGLSISWTPPVYGGSSPITSFTASTAGHSCVATGAYATSCVISGLTNGTAYNVRVVATNEVGTSPISAPATATPAGVPTTPTNFAGTPGNGTVTLTWGGSTGNGSPVTAYVIAVVDTVHKQWSYTEFCSSSPCLVEGLLNGQDYKFSAKAQNAMGTSSATSQITVNPGTTPGLPGDVLVVPASGKVIVSWQPADGRGRRVTSYTATAGSATCTTSLTTCALSGLTNGASVTVTVTATNEFGTSSPSYAVSATPGQKVAATPGAVTKLKPAFTFNPNTTSLTWIAPKSKGGGILRYSVWTSGDNKHWVFTDIAASNATRYLCNFQSSPTYVRLYVIGMNGARSAVASAKL